MSIPDEKRDEIDRLLGLGVDKTEISRRVGVARNTVINRAKHRLYQAMQAIDEEAEEGATPQPVGGTSVSRPGQANIPPHGHAESRLGHTITPPPGPSPPPVDPPRDPMEVELERMARQRDLVKERDLLKAVAGEKSFRAFLEGVMRDVAPVLPPVAIPETPQLSSSISRESMLFVDSDWHAYEIVRADRTMGFNEFNSSILCERVRRVTTSRIAIKQRLELGGWYFPEANVALNGDMISGTIHELERHSDASNVIHAVFSTGMLLSLSLRELAQHFQRINVRCTSGNHGRLPDARRVQQKDPTRSWDTAIYLYAMMALRDVTNITFDIPDSYFAIYEIEGFRFLQTHGHDIKSWNSIPYYGIDRFGRNVQALHNSRRERIDYFIISHFHSAGGVPAAGGETFVNGSLIGGNEFSIGALGKCDKPSQWLFTVHPEHGVASRWPIYGDGTNHVEPYQLEPWPRRIGA